MKRGVSSALCPTLSALGVFRSTWGRKATLVEANPAMRASFSSAPTADLTGTDWLERSSTPDERERSGRPSQQGQGRAGLPASACAATTAAAPTSPFSPF